MMRRIFALACAAAVAAAAPVSPAHAEFYSFEALQNMCRGESVEEPEFRTGAARELLRDIYRSRCRMYLLGLADGFLDAAADERRITCLPLGTDESEVAAALVAELLGRTQPPRGGVGEIVRDVLRNRYNCGGA
jgi:hypothetical protein